MNVFPLLVEKGLIKTEDVPLIEKEVAESKETLESILEKHGVTTDTYLATVSEKFGIPPRILPQGKEIEQAARSHTVSGFRRSGLFAGSPDELYLPSRLVCRR